MMNKKQISQTIIITLKSRLNSTFFHDLKKPQLD